MTSRSQPPEFEGYDIIDGRREAKPNPFKIGDAVRLRDGKATNGTVNRILGNQVLVAWDDVTGNPQWYHQDFVLPDKRPAESDRTPPPENKPDAKPNPFKIGDSVRLRDGTFTNGTVKGILVNELLVAWGNVAGDAQWYNQDFILPEKRPLERDAAPPPEKKPDAKPNPFKIGDSVRLRDGTFTNGTVKGILVNEVFVAWNNIAGEPQWYNQDFVLPDKTAAERSRASEVNQIEDDIVDQASRLVARMDDGQRRRFIARIQENYK